jgi:hypothetical protein
MQRVALKLQNSERVIFSIFQSSIYNLQFAMVFPPLSPDEGVVSSFMLDRRGGC